MKNKEKNFCPKCSSSNVKKNGTNKGRQRYFCNDCKKTFIKDVDKKRIHYSSKEKSFLSMLSNFLEPVNDENYSFKEIIKNLDESNSNINDVRLEHVEFDNKVKELQCYQPKILICKENNYITIYHFEIRHSKYQSHREIKLVDDNKNARHQKLNTYNYNLSQKTKRNHITNYEMSEFNFHDDFLNDY